MVCVGRGVWRSGDNLPWWVCPSPSEPGLNSDHLVWRQVSALLTELSLRPVACLFNCSFCCWAVKKTAVLDLVGAESLATSPHLRDSYPQLSWVSHTPASKNVRCWLLLPLPALARPSHPALLCLQAKLYQQHLISGSFQGWQGRDWQSLALVLLLLEFESPSILFTETFIFFLKLRETIDGVCVCVCRVCVGAQGGKKRVSDRSSAARVAGGWVTRQCGCWELNSGRTESMLSC